MTEAFVGFYSAPLRDLLGFLDDVTLRTLLVLASHIDARGVCFPHVRTIAAIGGMPIADVFEGLSKLDALGLLIYLRRDQHDPITHQQLPNAYALHPEIVLVQPLESASFITISNITKKPDPYYASAPIQKQNQDQESRTRIKNQNQEAKPEAQNHSSQQDSTSSNQPVGPQNQITSPAGKKTGQEQGKNQTTRSESKARSASGRDSSRAAPGEPRDLQPYKLPLEHGDAETLAQRLITSAADLSLTNARMLVDVYGPGRVRDSLIDFERDYTPRIKSPARYLRVLIRKNLFNADGEEWEK